MSITTNIRATEKPIKSQEIRLNAVFEANATADLRYNLESLFDHIRFYLKDPEKRDWKKLKDITIDVHNEWEWEGISEGERNANNRND